MVEKSHADASSRPQTATLLGTDLLRSGFVRRSGNREDWLAYRSLSPVAATEGLGKVAWEEECSGADDFDDVHDVAVFRSTRRKAINGHE